VFSQKSMGTVRRSIAIVMTVPCGWKMTVPSIMEGLDVVIVKA